jgi:hypothetical protein
MTPSPENRAAFAFDSTPIELPADLQESWHVLDFEIQQQERTKWCWAAVAASVARYYDPLSTFTQCSIASAELMQDCHCGGGKPDPDPCNVYGYLMSSLFRVGHFKKWVALRPATADEIIGETASERPLCARIAWYGGGAHLVVIGGYSAHDGAGAQAPSISGVAIADPWWGLSDINFEDFPNGYALGGRWTDNYYTER